MQEMKQKIGAERICAHAKCECPVNGVDVYCSTRCRDVSERVLPDSDHCLCGHEGCSHGTGSGD